MARERTEDLGRIAVMIDMLLDNEVFEEELIVAVEDEESDKLLLLSKFLKGVSEIHESLYKIRDIAYGEDSHNEIK